MKYCQRILGRDIGFTMFLALRKPQIEGASRTIDDRL